MFGLFIKNLRTKQRIGLREFCSRHGHDPSNWSKIEREALPPPRSDATLRRWARQLGLKPDTEDWDAFFNCAALDSGRIAKHIINGSENNELVMRMPAFSQNSGPGDTRPLYSTWCKARDLIAWAHHTLEAQNKLPALLRKLIHATVENPDLCQFPADEGTRRRGWDGILKTDRGNAWVPKGQSVWEMGTDQQPQKKAETEYKKRTKNQDPGAKNSTFIFITPRKWDGKAKWLKAKRAERNWHDVLVWDCDDLEQWLETAPAVDAWLARLLGKFPIGIRDITSYWLNLSATSNPPFPEGAFLAGRAKAETELREALKAAPSEVAIAALSLTEVRNFLGAMLATGHETVQGAEARALIVDTVDAWNQLCTTKNRLILVPNDQLTLERSMVAEAVRAGHHVITQRPYTAIRSEKGIRLPIVDRWSLQNALETAGFPDERASRLAREAGGSTSVLVRLGSHFQGQAAPAWSKPPESAVLVPLALVGAWSDKNTADRKLVERLHGESYPHMQQIMTHWIYQPDAPVRLAEGSYGFVSREDSWRLLSPGFTTDLLNRFMDIARDVLGEDDPRFDMPVNERYLASVYNKMPQYSPELREGIAETIALLGACGEHIPRGTHEGSSWRADILVKDLLHNANPKRWFSLASNLPLLAEASPDQFLSALETASKDLQTVAALFEKDANALFSSSPHTSLMWALEILAWDIKYLSRAVLALATLAKLDTGGQINPRPAGVLFEIFRFWFPQTSATLDERLDVLDLLSRREPEIAWKLLLDLIPQGHDTAMATVKPRWREFNSSQTKKVTHADVYRQAEWAAKRLVRIADQHIEKWSSLLEDFDKLPVIAQKATLNWLIAVDITALSEDVRLKLWELVRELVQKHRFFQNAAWRLPAETVNALAEIERKFCPPDPIVRAEWLFGRRAFEAFGNSSMPYEELTRLQTEAQAAAVSEVFRALGLDGVFKLASNLKFHEPVTVGALLEKSGLLSDWSTILPGKLASEKESERLVALGYAESKQRACGSAWIENLALEEWPANAVGQIALALKFEKKTWLMIRERKPEAEPFYWRRVRPWINSLSDSDLEAMIGALLQHGRPKAAIDAILSAIHLKKEAPSWRLVADAVEMALAPPQDSPEGGFNTYSIFELCEVVKHLQADPTADQERLVRLEWTLLPLARHERFEPKILHSELSRNPSFFVEVVAAMYCSRDESTKERRDFDPAKRALAEAAHHLIESWTGIPGHKFDGQIDSKFLSSWVDDVRRQCAENGRIEICDSKIGEQLSYAPSDMDGSWPCEAVRDVLEKVTTDEIIDGFSLGVFNQRGATSRGLNEGGEQERDLVKKYQGYAEKYRIRSPRTAMALRKIAEYYEVQAKWHDEHAEARNI